MSRYIRIDEAKERTTQLFHGYEVEQWIETLPSIDIVFCNECKHWRAYEDWSECELWTDDPYESAKTNADDFCSYGERQTERE